MDKNHNKEFFQLLNPDNTMSFNRLIAHAIGANETIIYFCLISKMMYYENRNRLDDDGFFYATSLDIQESTTFTPRQQTPAMKKLVNIGLIEAKLKGIPAKKYYRIIDNQKLILSLIEQGKSIADGIRKQRKHNDIDDVEASCDKMSKLEQTQENSQLRQNVETRIDKMSRQATTKCQSKDEQNVEASNDKMSEQVTTKCQNRLQQNVETSCDKMSHKSKYNNLNIINLDNNQSIYQSTEDDIEKCDVDKIDKIDELNRTRELIKSNIDYDYLILPELKNGKERVDEIVELMAETVVFNKKPIYIGGNPYPPEAVKSRFLKLTSEDIQYVFLCLDNSTSEIYNIKAYLIATLYNSKTTKENWYTSDIKQTHLL